MGPAEKFKNIPVEFYVNAPMKEHTYYRIGGPADFLIMPADIAELSSVIEICNEENIEYFLLGKGSNILVADSGYRGCMIDLTKHFNEITCEEDLINAGSGCSLAAIAKYAETMSLTGFEEFAGIPGTLGGALVMNAGCYNREISEIVKTAKVYGNGRVINILKENIIFGNRTSSLTGKIIISAELKLSKGNNKDIADKMKDLSERRRISQPLEMPSCGSVFKRPPGNFAGRLIEDAGLKGKGIGGAMVSDKHAGFIVNTGNATAEEVRKLIEMIKIEVKGRTGILLEEEVIFVGFCREEK